MAKVKVSEANLKTVLENGTISQEQYDTYTKAIAAGLTVYYDTKAKVFTSGGTLSGTKTGTTPAKTETKTTTAPVDLLSPGSSRVSVDKKVLKHFGRKDNAKLPGQAARNAYRDPSFLKSGGTPAERKAHAIALANMTIKPGLSAADVAAIKKARMWYTGQTKGRTGRGPSGDALYKEGSLKDLRAGKDKKAAVIAAAAKKKAKSKITKGDTVKVSAAAAKRKRAQADAAAGRGTTPPPAARRTASRVTPSRVRPTSVPKRGGAPTPRGPVPERATPRATPAPTPTAPDKLTRDANKIGKEIAAGKLIKTSNAGLKRTEKNPYKKNSIAWRNWEGKKKETEKYQQIDAAKRNAAAHASNLVLPTRFDAIVPKQTTQSVADWLTGERQKSTPAIRRPPRPIEKKIPLLKDMKKKAYKGKYAPGR